MNNIYNREKMLQHRLNTFLQERLRLPARDYYDELKIETLAELKSVLSDINNIFTVKVSLAFSDWLCESLTLSADILHEIRQSILHSPPNANGYDIEISTPVQVIAEVKCNIPINGGRVYGSAQRNGILKDINSLLSGKNKSQINPSACLKFLVLLDTQAIREATKHFASNMKNYRDQIVFLNSGTRPERKDCVYVVYVNCRQ